MFASDIDLNPRGDWRRVFEDMEIALDDTTHHPLHAVERKERHKQEMMAAEAQQICRSTQPEGKPNEVALVRNSTLTKISIRVCDGSLNLCRQLDVEHVSGVRRKMNARG